MRDRGGRRSIFDPPHLSHGNHGVLGERSWVVHVVFVEVGGDIGIVGRHKPDPPSLLRPLEVERGQLFHMRSLVLACCSEGRTGGFRESGVSRCCLRVSGFFGLNICCGVESINVLFALRDVRVL